MSKNSQRQDNLLVALAKILLLIADVNTIRIIQTVKDKKMQSGEILRQSYVPVAKFYQIMKSLVDAELMDRSIEGDRTVFYSLTPFAKILQIQTLIQVIDEEEDQSTLREKIETINQILTSSKAKDVSERKDGQSVKNHKIWSNGLTNTVTT
jgi:sugar-specific transcriptional regulator TrmB